MKRSGNHVVINWMAGCGRFFHINNALPVSYELSESRHFSYPVSMARVMARKRIKRIRSMGLRPATYLISVEDMPISVPLFDTQGESTNILLVRDPENLFASRIKKASAKHRAAYPRKNDATMQRAISVWLEHADELLAKTEHLQMCIGIFFDRWVCDPEYRKLIAARLGVACGEAPISQRAKEGDGSSFGGQKTVGPSEVGNLLKRRRLLNDCERTLLDQVMAAPRMQETRLRLLTHFAMNAA